MNTAEMSAFLLDHNVERGYPLSDADFSSYGGVLAPYTSVQVHAEESLNAGHDSLDPSDQTQAMRPKSFVSPQRGPVPHDQGMEEFTPSRPGSNVSPTVLRPMQSRIPPGYEPNKSFVTPSQPLVQKHDQANTVYGVQHPLGALMEDQNQNDDVRGVRFPTMEHFKLFVESLKSSFLTPGGNVKIHFQTAMGTMENAPVSNTLPTREESQTLIYIPSPSKERPAQHEVSVTQDWNEPVNTVSRQNEWSTINHMPSESLSVPDPAISTQNLVSTSDYSRQDSGPGPVSYPSPDFAVEQPVLSDHTGLSNGGFSRENLEDVTGSFDVQSKGIQPTSHKLSVQRPIQSSLSPGQDYYFSGHMNTSWVNALTSPSEGLGHHSDETAINLVSDQKVQQPKYASYISSGNPVRGYGGSSSSFDRPSKQVIQVQKLTEVPQADYVPSVQKPPSSTSFTEQSRPISSYWRSVRVYAPSFISSPSLLSESHEKPAQSQQNHQESISKEPEDIIYQPTVHIPVASGFYSSSDQLSPRNSGGYVNFQSSPTSSTKGSEPRLTFSTLVSKPKVPIKQNHVMLAPKPSSHESRIFNTFGSYEDLPGRVDRQNEVSNIKQPVKSHTGSVLTRKPHPSSLYNQSGQYGSFSTSSYLSNPRINPTHPSISTDQGKPDMFMQNQAHFSQEPKRIPDETNVWVPVSSELDSPHTGISSKYSEGYASFNSPNSIATSLEPKRTFPTFVSYQEPIIHEQNDVAFQPSDSDRGSSYFHSTSDEGVSGRFGTERIVSNMLPMTSQTADVPNVKETHGSFSSQNGQGSSQNRGSHVSVSRINPTHPFRPLPLTISQAQTTMQKHHALFPKKPKGMTNKPTAHLPASTASDSTVYQRRGGYASSKRPRFSTAASMPPPPLPSYVVKSRSNYVRGKVFFSQTRYTPAVLSGGKAAKELQKRATGRLEIKNARSKGVKDHERYNNAVCGIYSRTGLG